MNESIRSRKFTKEMALFLTVVMFFNILCSAGLFALTASAAEDTDKDQACDYGCAVEIGACVDTDKDHYCDHGCGEAFGVHADVDKNHACDYGCADKIGDCVDTDLDHYCDHGCGKFFGACTDIVGDGDHFCDYGCGADHFTDHAYALTRVDGFIRRQCKECGHYDVNEFYDVKMHSEKLTVTDSLVNAGYNNATAVRNALKARIADCAATKATIRYRFFEVDLHTFTVGGASNKLDAGTFPGDGTVEVYVKLSELPGFEEGAHTVYAAHMYATDAYGKTAGDIELFAVGSGLVIEDGYVKFTTTGLSPIAIAWTCAGHVDENGDHGCDQNCGEAVVDCVDENKDQVCDVCGAEVKKDNTGLVILLAVAAVLLLGGAIAVVLRVYRRKRERDEYLGAPMPKTCGNIGSRSYGNSKYGYGNYGYTTPTCANRPMYGYNGKPSTGRYTTGCYTKGCYTTGCNMMPTPPTVNCPVSTATSATAGYNTLASVNPAAASEWHPCRNGAVKPCDVNASSKQNVWWICRNGHEWQSPVYIRNAGGDCPYCRKTRR